MAPTESPEGSSKIRTVWYLREHSWPLGLHWDAACQGPPRPTGSKREPQSAQATECSPSFSPRRRGPLSRGRLAPRGTQQAGLSSPKVTLGPGVQGYRGPLERGPHTPAAQRLNACAPQPLGNLGLDPGGSWGVVELQGPFKGSCPQQAVSSGPRKPREALLGGLGGRPPPPASTCQPSVRRETSRLCHGGPRAPARPFPPGPHTRFRWLLLLGTVLASSPEFQRKQRKSPSPSLVFREHTQRRRRLRDGAETEPALGGTCGQGKGDPPGARVPTGAGTPSLSLLGPR